MPQINHTADRVPRSLRCLLLGLSSLTIATTNAIAQTPFPAPSNPTLSTYPACQPPAPGEYLLLVASKTADSQEQVRRSLPPGTPSVVCSYLNEVVVRVGGFLSLDLADAWAKYLSETIGVSAFIARPAGVAQVPTPPTASLPPTGAATDGSTFNPQPLGNGFAVLVDFFSRPELAAQVQQAIGRNIGLATYRQRPYLLAIYTTDQTAANATLQALSDRGFWTMIVDSRRVTLLRQTIDVQRATANN